MVDCARDVLRRALAAGGGEVLRAGDALRDGEAFRDGDALRDGDERRAGDAARLDGDDLEFDFGDASTAPLPRFTRRPSIPISPA